MQEQSEFVTFTLPKRAEDPPEFDGVYKLRFDWNALCDVENEIAQNLMRCVAGGQISAVETRALLYACLKVGHPAVLLTEAGDLLSRDSSTVLTALGDVLKRARGEEEVEPPTPITQPKADEPPESAIADPLAADPAAA